MLKSQELSFTELAKTVGERWQALVPDDKAIYESKSQAMKDTFYAQLADYKKTPEYAEYQRYLAEFKQKHEGAAGGQSSSLQAFKPVLIRVVQTRSVGRMTSK